MLNLNDYYDIKTGFIKPEVKKKYYEIKDIIKPIGDKYKYLGAISNIVKKNNYQSTKEFPTFFEYFTNPTLCGIKILNTKELIVKKKLKSTLGKTIEEIEKICLEILGKIPEPHEITYNDVITWYMYKIYNLFVGAVNESKIEIFLTYFSPKKRNLTYSIEDDVLYHIDYTCTDEEIKVNGHIYDGLAIQIKSVNFIEKPDYDKIKKTANKIKEDKNLRYCFIFYDFDAAEHDELVIYQFNPPRINRDKLQDFVFYNELYQCKTETKEKPQTLFPKKLIIENNTFNLVDYE